VRRKNARKSVYVWDTRCEDIPMGMLSFSY